MANDIVNKDLTRESAKFHTIYEKLNEELRKVNRVIRDEINQRVASYVYPSRSRDKVQN